MQNIMTMVINVAWWMNGIGMLLILITYISSNKKSTWAGIGILLVLIGIGNALIVACAGLRPSETAASLLGLVVYGSLGARFIGNWLTDKAT